MNCCPSIKPYSIICDTEISYKQKKIILTGKQVQKLKNKGRVIIQRDSTKITVTFNRNDSNSFI